MPAPAPAGGAAPGAESEALEADCCPVCLDRFALGAELMLLPCRHVFHPECVTTWLRKSVRCPFCRAEAGRPEPFATTD